MGMYTQIYVKATFKENLSDNVVNIIKYMLNMDDIKLEDLDLPNHPLFITARWEWMLKSGIFYHIPFAVNRFEYNEVSKNYYLINQIQRRHWRKQAELVGLGAYLADSIIDEVITATPRVIAQIQAQLPANFPTDLAESILTGLHRQCDKIAAMP